MQSKESLNEVLSKPIVEEFSLPSGIKARRFKFSARDAMAVQREFVQRSQNDKTITEDDFQLFIICKCIQINNGGNWEHIIFEDIDNTIDGYDYIVLFTKISGLTNKEGTEVNPNLVQ